MQFSTVLSLNLLQLSTLEFFSTKILQDFTGLTCRRAPASSVSTNQIVSLSANQIRSLSANQITRLHNAHCTHACALPRCDDWAAASLILIWVFVPSQGTPKLRICLFSYILFTPQFRVYCWGSITSWQDRREQQTNATNECVVVVGGGGGTTGKLRSNSIQFQFLLNVGGGIANPKLSAANFSLLITKVSDLILIP